MEGQNSGGGPISIDMFNFAEQNLINVPIRVSSGQVVTTPSRRLHGAVLVVTAGERICVGGSFSD